MIRDGGRFVHCRAGHLPSGEGDARLGLRLSGLPPAAWLLVEKVADAGRTSLPC